MIATTYLESKVYTKKATLLMKVAFLKSYSILNQLNKDFT